MNKKITIDIPAQMAKVIVLIGEPDWLKKQGAAIANHPASNNTEVVPAMDEAFRDNTCTALTARGHPFVVAVNTANPDFNLARSISHEMVHVADQILAHRKVRWEFENEIYPHMIGYLVAEVLNKCMELKQ